MKFKPKVIRSQYAIAAISLMNHLLDEHGIVSSVGYPDPRYKRRELIVRWQSGDPTRIPDEWKGFTVTAEQVLQGAGT